MSFAATIRNRNSERVIALVSALAVILSMMVIFAPRAEAHNGTVTWGCDGWSVTLSAYSTSGTNVVTVTVDGVQVEHQSSNWSSFQASGTWDDTETHTLTVFVNAWDDGDQPVYTLGSNGSFSPNWQSGEYSFTLNITQDACDPPPPPSGWVCDEGSVVFLQDASDWTGTLYETAEAAGADPDCVPPPPPSGWVCDEGSVVFLQDASDWTGTLYETELAAGADPDCVPPPPPSGWVCDEGSVVFLQDASDWTGTLYETELAAGADPDCVPPPPPSGWVCDEGSVVFLQDASDWTGTLYETELAAGADPDCVPPPPPSEWVCDGGVVMPIGDVPGWEGRVYGTEEEAANDPGCQDVAAATTFTIGGTCALVGDVASFTISGSLGEGLTLTVAGQTIDTSPFSVNTGAAGSFPYSVVLDEGFELAVGSPAAAGVILIPDCTIDDEIEDVDELPFTGLDAGALAVASIGLLGTGTMVLMSSRRREES